MLILPVSRDVCPRIDANSLGFPVLVAEYPAAGWHALGPQP